MLSTLQWLRQQNYKINFFYCGLTLYNATRKVAETLINRKSIADAQVCRETQSIQLHHGVIQGLCHCSSPPCEDEKDRSGKKSTEADRQRLKMRRKDGGRKDTMGEGERMNRS